MESVDGPRRFSILSISKPFLDDSDLAKADQYGTVADASELEAILGEGEAEIHTTARKEARLLFGYSVPLTITYLLQYSFSLRHHIRSRPHRNR